MTYLDSCIFDGIHKCRLQGFVAGGEEAGIYLCVCGKRWFSARKEERE
jgi:hypothetical protein